VLSTTLPRHRTCLVDFNIDFNLENGSRGTPPLVFVHELNYCSQAEFTINILFLLTYFTLVFFEVVSLAVVAEVSCSSPRSTRDYVIMAHRRHFFFADKLVYMCRRGLVPLSDPVLTCTSTGRWDKLPHCKGSTI